MKTLILAGGFGTRLGPQYEGISKAAIKIGGEPMLTRLLKQVSDISDDIYVITNSLHARQVYDIVKDRSAGQVTVVDNQITNPKCRLGALGDIRHALSWIKLQQEDLLIIGCDQFFTFDLQKVYWSTSPCVQVIAYPMKCELTDPRLHQYGTIKLKGPQDIPIGSGMFEIDTMLEKSTRPLSNLVATCIYYVPYGIMMQMQLMLHLLQADNSGEMVNWWVRNAYAMAWVASKDSLWIDIGSEESIKLAENSL